MDVPVAFLSPSYLPPSAPSGRLLKAKRCHRRRPRCPSVIVASAATGTEEDFVVKDSDTFEKFRADFFSQPPSRFEREEGEASGEDRVLQRLRNQVEEREYSAEYIASVLLKKYSSTAYEEEDEEISIWEQQQQQDNDNNAQVEDEKYEQLRKAADEFFAEADNASIEEAEEIESNINSNDTGRLKSLSTKLMEVQTRRSRVDFREEEIESTVQAGADISLSKPGGSPTRLDVFESMKNADVITAEAAGYNSITRVAERLARERSGFPFVPKPIPVIEDAFRAAKTISCIHCGAKFVPDKDEDSEKLCTKCYADLFLKNDPVTGANPEDRTYSGLSVEVRKEVKRVWSIRNARRKGTGKRSIPARRQRSVWQMAEENSESGSGSNNSSIDTGVVSRSNESGIAGGNNGSTNGLPPPPTSATGTRSDDWNVAASRRSLRTINPIRELVQGIDVAPNPALDVIKLSVGDPTVYGNLKVSQRAVDAYCEAIRSGKHNGYSLSYGSLPAREAVANRYTLPQAPLNPDDIVLASGTSGALELCIGALCNEGDNILLARPGFPLFATIAGNFGVECRYYDTLPNQRWEISTDKLPNIIDANTAAIVVNNPSNPCGSVYSKEHILEILAVAEKYHLPVIADEVYADMAFSASTFHSIGSLSKNVPVLSVGGISKQFVVPGWRLGWVCIHDRNNIFSNGGVRRGIRQLTTRMLVPNTPAQACVPALLEPDAKDDADFGELMTQLECNAVFTVKALAKAPGLRCIEPQGAMYTMAEIDTQLLGFEDDMHFTKTLLHEESVFVLPGQCFQAPNFVRIVFCAPQFVLSEAFHRIRRFCKRHAKAQ